MEFWCMDNIQEECSVRFTRIAPKFKEESIKIFHLNASAVERIRGCVAIFILVAVYSVYFLEEHENLSTQSTLGGMKEISFRSLIGFVPWILPIFLWTS